MALVRVLYIPDLPYNITGFIYCLLFPNLVVYHYVIWLTIAAAHGLSFNRLQSWPYAVQSRLVWSILDQVYSGSSLYMGSQSDPKSPEVYMVAMYKLGNYYPIWLLLVVLVRGYTH
jgi:hypothetical protein